MFGFQFWKGALWLTIILGIIAGLLYINSRKESHTWRKEKEATAQKYKMVSTMTQDYPHQDLYTKYVIKLFLFSPKVENMIFFENP